MRYNIKGTDLSITDEIRTYVEKKLDSLNKFISDIETARADIELGFLRDEAKQYRAELMFYEPGLPKKLRAVARGDALHEAIDLASAELFRLMTQDKRKRLDIFRRSAVKVKEYLRGWRDTF